LLRRLSDNEEGQYGCAIHLRGQDESAAAQQRLRLLYAPMHKAVQWKKPCQADIPYRIYGGLSFYKRKEIKDLLAYFRLVINHNDEKP